MNVLMLVMTDVAHDARVLREAETLAGQGYAIHIVGKDVPAGWVPPAGVTVESVSGGSGLKPSSASGGAAAESPLRKAARWALLPQHRQRVWRTWCAQARAAVGDRKFDVVHAHDFNVLKLAAELAESSNARLVYDSHEWWSGRERHGRPTPIERSRERRIEQRIAARADAVLTVSGGIALRLERWHGRPVAVVRNTFPLRGAGAIAAGAGAGNANTNTNTNTNTNVGANADSSAVPTQRPDTPLSERPIGVVYAGRIGPARDIETLLEATAKVGLQTLLLGKADREFLTSIRVSTASLRIEPARPVDDVDEVLRKVGISIVSLTDTCENHRLALPNKVFHAVRAGVPVVAADLPELRRLVTDYGLGTLYRPGDAESMAAALRRLSAEYPKWCAQVAAARAELNWERDAEVLVGVYEALAVEPSRAATVVA